MICFTKKSVYYNVLIHRNSSEKINNINSRSLFLFSTRNNIVLFFILYLKKENAEKNNKIIVLRKSFFIRKTNNMTIYHSLIYTNNLFVLYIIPVIIHAL